MKVKERHGLPRVLGDSEVGCAHAFGLMGEEVAPLSVGIIGDDNASWDDALGCLQLKDLEGLGARGRAHVQHKMVRFNLG